MARVSRQYAHQHRTSREVQEAGAEFGEEISTEQAHEMLARLVQLYLLLVCPLPSERVRLKESNQEEAE